MAANSPSNLFSALDARQNASPTSSHAGNSQINGNGIANSSGSAGAYMPPLPAGHQSDLNFLYSQMQELSEVLRNNREKVKDVLGRVENVAVGHLLSYTKQLLAYSGLDACQRSP